MEKLIYGTAYYDEYMPYDRLAEDVKMMKKAGINTVRIAESTWSTCEPQEGVFDFSHVERVLDAMEEDGLLVSVVDRTHRKEIRYSLTGLGEQIAGIYQAVWEKIDSVRIKG